MHATLIVRTEDDGVEIVVSSEFIDWCETSFTDLDVEDLEIAEKSIKFIDNFIVKCSKEVYSEEANLVSEEFGPEFEILQRKPIEEHDCLVTKTDQEEWECYIAANTLFTGEAVGDFMVAIYRMTCRLRITRF